jgi:hypothetical protein
VILFILFLLPFFVFSQSNKEVIQQYLTSPSAKSIILNRDFNDWLIQSEGGTTSTGVKNCYVIQRYQGIEIFRAVSNFSLKNDKVIDVQKRIVEKVSQKVNTTIPTLLATEALTKAYFYLGITANTSFAVLKESGLNKFKIINSLGTDEPINAALVYHQANDNKLVLAWDFTIHTPTHDHLWSVRIDALNGQMLEKNDLVISCSFDKNQNLSSTVYSLKENLGVTPRQIYSGSSSLSLGGSYRVIPFNFESPIHSPFQLISNPSNSKASPFGWHDTNAQAGAEYTITRGNNVWAKDDFKAANLDDGLSPDGGSALVFDFPYGGANISASSYIDAANTNLFYMNNVMHDVWYQYGFDEASGNFQENNYERGGIAGDYVNAEAQDGSLAASPSLNNANFTTPVDGNRGRMQMFLWNRGPEIKPLIITSPSSLSGSYVANQNAFNPGRVDLPIAPEFLQSDLVLYLDSEGDKSEACVAPSNGAAMNGKIAIVRRGNCTFAIKVRAAQNAGAVAVIVVNNVDGNITMSGADASITIPAISVSSAIGETIINQMKTVAINVKIQTQSTPFVNTDGDFDNGIIAHEYGHGISIRLAGGANNSSCLNNTDQMGEGWSDWFALMIQLKPGDFGGAKRGIATFVSSQSPDGLGIRDFVYSTDRGLNPMTYAFTNSYQFLDKDNVEQTSVHGVGSVWATMLWDLTWAYIGKYGYDNNKYTGYGR